MKSAFDPKTGEWQLNWPGRVSRHDVVYLSPPGDPIRGLPIGNGDVGVLVWCEESRIVLAVNKCDLWDYAAFGRFHNWSAEEEEYSTTLRHAGRIVIDFKLPVFDFFYLSDFSGRISLADATVAISASGPLGSVSIRGFVGLDDGTICCEVESETSEDLPVEISVQRFGSRTFSHWYRLINRDPSIGLDGTSSLADANGAYITQVLSSGTFAMGATVATEESALVAYSRDHSRAAKAVVSGGASKRFSILAAVTSPLSDDPIPTVKNHLSVSGRTGIPAMLESHSQGWKTFWMTSLMESGEDYLDNLWHLTMYYANSSQRGRFPGRFINGLWGWNRDVQNWNFYFHWNQQETYWPLNAAGHSELADSYLDYRFNSLPHAGEDAKEFFGTEGIFVSDVCDARGYNSESEFHNHTPVAQIAMDFWRQYMFTGDLVFLRERALPYIVEAARFFQSRLEKGEDGRFHATDGTGYEGWIRMRDCISELVYAKVLLTTALKALELTGQDDSHAALWRDILANLAPLPLAGRREDCLVETGGKLVLDRGLFRGDDAAGDVCLAAGHGIEEGYLLCSKNPVGEASPVPAGLDPYEMIQTLEANESPVSLIREDMKLLDGIFPFVEYSAVFPSGLVGLADRGAGLFDAAVNTAKLYAPDCMGWDPIPIVLARLGLSRELGVILGHWPDRWQFFCNGFGHYGPRDIMKAESDLMFRTTTVMDASLPAGEREANEFRFPTWPFKHMGMESMSVLACAMNESLLQSHGGTVRVAPAVLDTRSARFTLHAEGGFVVSSEVRDGKPLWINVKCLRGGVCRLANPWPRAYLFRNGSPAGSDEGAEIVRETEVGDQWFCSPSEDVLEGWETEPTDFGSNASPKASPSGKSWLGIPRMF